MIPRQLISIRSPVELFRIRFPRLTREEAVSFLVSRVKEKQGLAVCFPDMSTLNQVAARPEIGQLIQDEFLPLNDGIGLKIGSSLEGRPFLANLNGTDLTPALLRRLPSGTKVFLVGAAPGVAEATLRVFKEKYSQVQFLGAAHGFLSPDEEQELLDTLEHTLPDVVLVAMGNPLQLNWIHNFKTTPGLDHTVWLAVGGLFDFYGGTRVRAPLWMRKCYLEWLHIVYVQPHKLARYFVGIPRFFWHTCIKSLLRQHSCTTTRQGTE